MLLVALPPPASSYFGAPRPLHLIVTGLLLLSLVLFHYLLSCREGNCAGVFCIAGNTVEEKLSAPSSSLVHQPAEDPVLPLLRRCTCSVGYAWWDFRGLRNILYLDMNDTKGERQGPWNLCYALKFPKDSCMSLKSLIHGTTFST